jgi:hypothetical protein
MSRAGARLERLESEQLADLSEQQSRASRPVGAEKGAIDRSSDQGGARALKQRPEQAKRARATSARAAELKYGEIPELRAAAGRAGGRAREQRRRRRRCSRRRSRRRHRRGGGQVDRHPGEPPGGERAASCCTWRTPAASAWSARTRPSRPWPTRCAAARAGLRIPNRPIGVVPLPRPHRRGQDGAGQGPGRVPVR